MESNQPCRQTKIGIEPIWAITPLYHFSLFLHIQDTKSVALPTKQFVKNDRQNRTRTDDTQFCVIAARVLWCGMTGSNRRHPALLESCYNLEIISFAA